MKKSRFTDSQIIDALKRTNSSQLNLEPHKNAVPVGMGRDPIRRPLKLRCDSAPSEPLQPQDIVQR